MKNSIKAFAPIAIILIIAGVLVLAGGGFYLYQKANIKNQNSGQPAVQDETANWKTYTNYAFGFSIKLPSSNNVYTCEDVSSRPKLANEKSYSVFIIENPLNIDLIKSCVYSETVKYNRLTINARQQNPGEYSSFVEDWKKSYGDGKYAIVKEVSFAQHDALLKTKVEAPSNNNPYEEMIINGGAYFYSIGLDKKSDSLEKILSSFKIVVAKDTFSDWQTLISNDLGIEIKYPYNYRTDIVNSKLVGASELTIYPVPQPIEFGPRLVISRNSDHIYANTSVDTYVDSFIDKYKSLKERGCATINGTKWTKVRYSDVSGVGPETTYVNYFAIKNGYMYAIRYNDASQVETSIFEKITTTIKFISTVSSPMPTNPTVKAKTYTNTQYGFSVQYPQDWKVPTEYPDPYLEWSIINSSGTDSFRIQGLPAEKNYTLTQFTSIPWAHSPNDPYADISVGGKPAVKYDIVTPLYGRGEGGPTGYTRMIQVGVQTPNGSFLSFFYEKSFKTKEEAQAVDMSKADQFLSWIKF